jgi:citrate lyase beta subunit
MLVAAKKERYLEKLLELEGENKPDCVLLDLEDSAKEHEKQEARENLREYFKDDKYRKKLTDKYHIAVRVNPFNSSFFEDDIELVKSLDIDFVMSAKTESVEEVNYLEDKLPEKQKFIVLESREGLDNKSEILDKMKENDLFALGYEDLSSELMIERPSDLSEINPISKIIMDSVIEAKSRDIMMVDAPSRKFDSESKLDELKQECEFTYSSGLTSKVAINPAQISTINKVFSKKELVEKAERVIEKVEGKDGKALNTDEHGDLLGLPSYRKSKKILQLWNR